MPTPSCSQRKLWSWTGKRLRRRRCSAATQRCPPWSPAPPSSVGRGLLRAWRSPYAEGPTRGLLCCLTPWLCRGGQEQWGPWRIPSLTPPVTWQHPVGSALAPVRAAWRGTERRLGEGLRDPCSCDCVGNEFPHTWGRWATAHFPGCSLQISLLAAGGGNHETFMFFNGSCVSACGITPSPR